MHFELTRVLANNITITYTHEDFKIRALALVITSLISLNCLNDEMLGPYIPYASTAGFLNNLGILMRVEFVNRLFSENFTVHHKYRATYQIHSAVENANTRCGNKHHFVDVFCLRKNKFQSFPE